MRIALAVLCVALLICAIATHLFRAEDAAEFFGSVLFGALFVLALVPERK